MAQILQSIEDLELFFADLVSELTGLPDEKVLVQYPEWGQESNKYKGDLAFVNVNTRDETTVNFKNRKYVKEGDTQLLSSQQSSRVVEVHIVFYGPNCNENALTFNEKLYFDTTKLELSAKYLFFIPDYTGGPTKINENFNGRWWVRCDYRASFYNTIQIENTVETFESVDIKMEVDN